jgi:hypothetical protein
MTVERMYFHALNCGHESWISTYPQSGVSWCHACGKFVGVAITTDRPTPPPKTIPPIKESDGT